MLTAWGNFAQDRRCKPSNIRQILTEPLFDNRFITIRHNIGEKQLIFYPNWCNSNVIVTQIENITYGVVPKMLPREAIGELLSTNNIKKVSKQYSQILVSLPTEWRHLLSTTTDKPDDNFFNQNK